MQQQGHIRLLRTFKDWRYFSDPPTCHLFGYLLLSANYTTTEYRDIKLERGQLSVTQIEISRETGLTRQQIRTGFNKLIAVGEINTKQTKGRTLVTICKYDSYLDAQPNNNQTTTNGQPTNNQEPAVDTSLINKEKEIYKESSAEPHTHKSSSKKFVKPTIEEIQAYITEKGYNFSAEKFFYFYEARGWMSGKTHIKNWKACCATWKRNDDNNQTASGKAEQEQDSRLQKFLTYAKTSYPQIYPALEQSGDYFFSEALKIVDDNSRYLADIVSEMNKQGIKNNPLDDLREMFEQGHNNGKYKTKYELSLQQNG